MNRHKRHVFLPYSDDLEARVALSLGDDAPEVPQEMTTLAATTMQPTSTTATAISAVVAARPTPVIGTIAGRYIATGQDNRAADAPYRVDVNASGMLAGLGKVTMTGSINFGGFMQADHPDISGTITLTNAKGSVTVRVTGFGGNGPIPNHRFGLNASVVSGTGAYANFRGIGTSSLVFGKNTVRSITTPTPIGGAMSMHFNLRPPIR